jgi:hypothetical protein
LSAPGEFTPPEFPGGIPQDPNSAPPSPGPGLSPGVAIAILAGVLALGLIAVFTIGHGSSGGTSLTSQPGPTPAVHGLAPSTSPSSTSAPTPTGAASTPAGTTSTDPAGDVPPGNTSTQDPDDSPTSADTPEFTVGECVDTSGTGSTFSVTEAGCSGADYKIIYAFQNETGDINNDMAQCYTINGNDNEFENGDDAGGYTLYCLNSLTGDYSPRRADVDNCLDSSATYEVDCSNSKATWIVIGRLNGTTNTKGCSQFGSYDNSYYWTSTPPFVLCVDTYKH